MNKNSKYRPLMDEMELGIAGGDISTQKLYRHMMNALDDAEAVELKLVKELEAVKANMRILEIYHKDIDQIKADAVKDFYNVFRTSDGYVDVSVTQARHYANSLINNKEG